MTVPATKFDSPTSGSVTTSTPAVSSQVSLSGSTSSVTLPVESPAITGGSLTGVAVIVLVPVRGTAKPSVTLVAMVKSLL